MNEKEAGNGQFKNSRHVSTDWGQKKPKAHLEKVDNVVIEEKRQVDVAQMVERPLPTTVANLINALRSQFMTLPRDVLKVDS